MKKPFRYIVYGILAVITLTTLLRSSERIMPEYHSLRIAESHRANGELTEAEKSYQRAIEDLPGNPEPALRLAQLYRDWDRPELGLRTLTEAVRRGATPEDIVPLRMRFLANLGNWRSLEEVAGNYLRAYPNNIEAQAYLTQAQIGQNKCAVAAESASQWATTAPDSEQAQKIAQYLETGDLRKSPVSEELGFALVRQNQWGLAACVLESITPTMETEAWLGESLSRLGIYDKAQVHLENAVQLAPEDPLGWTLQGMHYLRYGKVEEAEATLLQAHNLDTYNPALCLAMTEVLSLAGRYEEISEWTQGALERAPEDAEIWKAVARFYLNRNLQDSGFPIRAVEGAVRLAPEDAEAHMLMGWTYLQTNEPVTALESLNEALALSSDDGQVHYLRGLALEQMGNMAEAEKEKTHAANLGYFPPRENH